MADKNAEFVRPTRANVEVTLYYGDRPVKLADTVEGTDERFFFDGMQRILEGKALNYFIWRQVVVTADSSVEERFESKAQQVEDALDSGEIEAASRYLLELRIIGTELTGTDDPTVAER